MPGTTRELIDLSDERKAIGCVICGHESRTEHDNERHFAERHRMDFLCGDAKEDPDWVEFWSAPLGMTDGREER